MTAPPTANDAIRVFEELTRFQQQMYDKASAYIRIIIGLAYAGFFTVWAGTNRYMGRSAVLWSALLMSLSVMAYVAFEVVQMLFLSLAALKFSKAAQVNPLNLQASMETFRQWEIKSHRRLVGFWFMAIVLSVVPGFAAACVLVVSFVHRLLRP
jgi:hypothetical protein